MKAIIFAAGLGTRLYPLTNSKPKALVDINGVTLLELAIFKIASSGIRDIIINVHHFASQINDFLDKKNNFGLHIEISDESDELLDTGGGLIKASHFFNDNIPFLAYNVDVLSNINIEAIYESHIRTNALATLAVRNRNTGRYFLFDNLNRLAGWENKSTGEQKIQRNSGILKPLAFSGIQIISPQIFRETKLSGKFSLTDLYLSLAAYHDITGFEHNEGYWLDLGKPQNIKEAEKILNSENEI